MGDILGQESPLFHHPYYTLVVHNRDDQEVGMAHKVKSPENQPQFSQTTMGQYSNQAFRSTRNAFKICLGILIFLIEFSTD